MTKRPEALEKVLELFRPLAKRAKAAGLRLAFENCGCSPEECYAALDALAVSGWGQAWDVWADWTRDKDERERDFDAYVLRRAKRALGVHVKAAGGIAAAGYELVPYKRIFALCSAAGFKGPVSVETHNKGKTLTDLEASRQLVETVFAAWPS